jgi:hypothetical protein
MLGHDPDWTHHTSEDKIDKTDASEFRRAGTFATAAAWFMATADSRSWKRVRAGAYADRVAELARRLAQDSTSDTVIKRILKNRYEFDAQAARLDSLTPQAREGADPGVLSGISVPRPAYRRTTFLPFDASAFEGVSPDDAKWLAYQEALFASDSEGLATKPNFALISFEAQHSGEAKAGGEVVFRSLDAERSERGEIPIANWILRSKKRYATY